MPEPEVGANTTSVTLGTPATADTLTPPVNDGFSRIDPTVDNVSDIDGIPTKVEETKPAVTAEKKAEDAKAAETKAAEAKATAEKADLERFDNHPRFQELRAERDAIKAELAEIKNQLKVLTPQDKAAVVEREAKELPFKDITKIPKAELLEWQEEDPVGYAANLYQQMLHESRETLAKEAKEKEAVQMQERQKVTVKQQYEAYAKANPNFMKAWEDGTIQKVMDSNPVLFPNAVAAHMALTLSGYKKGEEARTKAAVDKAVKEAEERVRKDFQAKRNAEVIGDGGAVRTEGTPDELKHPDKYGGSTQTLATRLSRLRQAAVGG